MLGDARINASHQAAASIASMVNTRCARTLHQVGCLEGEIRPSGSLLGKTIKDGIGRCGQKQNVHNNVAIAHRLSYVLDMT